MHNPLIHPESAAPATLSEISDAFPWSADLSMCQSTYLPGTCIGASRYCREHCYRYRYWMQYGRDTVLRAVARRMAVYPRIRPADMAKWTRNASARQRRRVRLAREGDALSSIAWIDIAVEWAIATPDTTWWIPTRAWRTELRDAVLARLMGVPNVALLASTDPSTTPAELESLRSEGWSTMHFGSASISGSDPERVRCPKTHDHVRGACSSCEVGCFRAAGAAEQVHVLLDEHSRVDQATAQRMLTRNA